MFNRQTLIMILLMTLMMGVVMSAWFTWQIDGFGPAFVGSWATRFVSTYVVVLPTVLVVSPIAQRLAKMMAGQTSHAPVGTTPRAVALEALRRNARGHNGEGFAPWLDMLADDVVITMPLGAFRGENRGLEQARAIYGAIEMANPRIVYDEPLRISEAGQTVVIEFHDHGTIAGFPYQNRIAASFDVKGGKIAAYREYFGDIDPDIVSLMVGSGKSAIQQPISQQARAGTSSATM